MQKIRRINFLAGPGVGKSTKSAWLFSQLKHKQFNVELVTEYVKSWALAKRPIDPFDQVYLFGKQMNSEYRNLKHGIELIVTDSPLILSSVYCDLYYPDLEIGGSIQQMANQFEKQFASLNILLRRDPISHPYKQTGRYQTEQQSIEIDDRIEHKVRQCCDPSTIFEVMVNDDETLLDEVIHRLTA